MRNKKIFGMPIMVLAVVILAVGLGTAALLTYYVDIVGDTTVEQSVVFEDETVSKDYAFSGSASAGETYEEMFTLWNRASVPAVVALETKCSVAAPNDCEGIDWEYISTPKANDDGSGSFGDSETIAYKINTNGETLDEIFSGEGFSYTYEVVQGDGTAPLVPVFELDNGNHVVIFPGYSVRTGEHSLTFNETVATATADSGDVVADFGLYDSEFVGIDTGVPYQNWADTRDLDDYSVDGTETVVDAYFMTQGAGTGQEDAILNFVYNGEQTTFKQVTDWNNITLQPGEKFNFISVFDFNIALTAGDYNIETQVVPVLN